MSVILHSAKPVEHLAASDIPLPNQLKDLKEIISEKPLAKNSFETIQSKFELNMIMYIEKFRNISKKALAQLASDSIFHIEFSNSFISIMVGGDGQIAPLNFYNNRGQFDKILGINYRTDLNIDNNEGFEVHYVDDSAKLFLTKGDLGYSDLKEIKSQDFISREKTSKIITALKLAEYAANNTGLLKSLIVK